MQIILNYRIYSHHKTNKSFLRKVHKPEEEEKTSNLLILSRRTQKLHQANLENGAFMANGCAGCAL